MVYDNGMSNGSIVLCAVPPYYKWIQHNFSDIQDRSVRVSNLVHDIQREAKVLLVKDIVKVRNFVISL